MRDDVDRANGTFVSAWTWLARNVPSGVYGEHDGMVVAATGLPDPALNPAVVVHEPDDPVAAVKWAARFRRESGLESTGVDIADGRHPRLEEALTSLGYVRHAVRPGMALRVDALRRPTPPDGLELRLVRSPEDWAAYTQVQVDEFGLAPAVATQFPPYSTVGRPAMELLVGSLDGVVTCTAATFVNGGTGGIFAVATRSECRGRGHGSAVTSAAVDAAAAMGAELVALQSTPAGFGVYRSLGFAEVRPWVVWVDPTAEPAT